MPIRKKTFQQSEDIGSVFIGKIIEDELRRQGHTVTWLSRQINCDRRNVYHIFSRNCIDTELLLRLCKVLDTDFFAYYSQILHNSDDVEKFNPPVLKGK